jgi:hypothetical protein
MELLVCGRWLKETARWLAAAVRWLWRRPKGKRIC